MTLKIRESMQQDDRALDVIYALSFPDEDLMGLVRDLLSRKDDVISLVASDEGSLIAHIVFTNAHLDRSDLLFSLLGPLAVVPSWQRKGVGSHMVRDGLQRLRRRNVSRVFVLGDPAYYHRFGFVPDRDVAPPYPLPRDWDGAWQSVGLSECSEDRRGTLLLPEPWHQRALWQP